MNRYDVFSDDVQHPAESPVMGHESRPAIEVIEMANGETVWYAPHSLAGVYRSSLIGLS